YRSKVTPKKILAMKTIVLFAVFCAALAGPAFAQDQHRRPDDIQQYLNSSTVQNGFATRSPPRSLTRSE
ncbi:MAG: hypothetical protein ABIU05_15000, partial [Nitrospirales bacterium]